MEYGWRDHRWREGRRDEPEYINRKARWREGRRDEPENITRKARGIIKYKYKGEVEGGKAR